MNANCAAAADAAWAAVANGRHALVPPIATMLETCGRTATAGDCPHALACRACTLALRTACAEHRPGA
jgi:hypothetical protein